MSAPLCTTAPSETTELENLKSAQFAREIQEKDDLRGGGAAQNRASNDFLLEVPAAGESAELQSALHSIERQIDDGYRMLRLEHLARGELDLEMHHKAEQEAARRRKQEEQRRARKREQMARDPHRKITLKLANKKRFEMHTLDRQGIPMHTYSHVSSTGREQVALVDVQALASKCHGLLEGIHSVSELIELRERRERFGKIGSAASSQPSLMQHASSLPTLSAASSAENSLTLPSNTQVSYEDRLEKVMQKRMTLDRIKLDRKMSLKRERETAKEKPACDVFDVMGRSAHWVHMMRVNSGNLSGEPTPKAPMMTRMASERPSSKRRSQVFLARMASTGVGGKLGRRRSGTPERISGIVLRKRAERLRRALLGTIRVLLLWFFHARMSSSAGIVKRWIWQLGEWARIKNAVHRTIRAVKVLQRHCRFFLSTKGRRCDVINKDWQRVEDNFLSSFFKQYAYYALEEHASRARGAAATSDHDTLWPVPAVVSRRRKGAKTYTREETDQLVSGSKNWQLYRIPLKERKALINHYYNVKLKKHLQHREALLSTVQQNVHYQRELVTFLKEFGADDRRNSLQMPAMLLKELALPSFWECSEDLLVDLISVAAEALKTVRPFPDHPLNKGGVLQQETFDKYVRPPRMIPADVRATLLSHMTHRTQHPDSPRDQAREGPRRSHVAGQRNSKRTVTTSMKQVPMEKKQVDLDELWRSFTPRLQEITQEQAEADRRMGGQRDSVTVTHAVMAP